MAQYDLLLTQNTAAAGVEYSEKFVNIAKGGILSADASGVPTVLAAGTDGYMLVRDNAATSGLKWQAITGGHTQGTDTGTTSDTFTFDSDSVLGRIIVDPTAGAADLTLTLTNEALTASSKTITFPNATGTVALTSQLHTQGTDVGTTSTIFELDTDGFQIELTAESASILGVKVNGGATYADLKAKDLTLSGNLTVNGTTTTINATTLTVDDKNIELGSVAVPDDTTADGGGITLRGATDKTILWDNANDNWSFNQNVNLLTGTTYKINNTTVLSSTQVLGVTLGSMASETATNYVPKSLYDANTVLYSTADNTPLALTVGASTFVGRKAAGDISAITANETLAILWASQVAMASAPASKTATGVQGNIAFDANYMYLCTGTNTWKRTAFATNW